MHNRSLAIALAVCGLSYGMGAPAEKRDEWKDAMGLRDIPGQPPVNQRFARRTHGSTRIRSFKRLKNRARNGS